ncbi:MAG: hypothetical protein FJX72_15295, partial [Armatimonadetes bacterium]|nr:hypothetical protein [Armatimonadota bacterium]
MTCRAGALALARTLSGGVRPAVVVLAACLAVATMAQTGMLAYRTTWLGNTFGGGPKWVQNFIEGMAVAPDGTVICASTWDEA